MQRSHSPIQVNAHTAKIIVDGMKTPTSSAAKKAFVRESLKVASLIKTTDTRLFG